MDDGADDRRSLLQLQLGSTSLLDLGLPGIWTASFVERGRDAVAVQLASWHNTLSIVAALSCGMSTTVLVAEDRFLPSAIPGVAGSIGCLITVMICVLHENTVRQLYDPRAFVGFIVRRHRSLRLPVVVFSVSVHGIAAQIVFFAWDKSLVLGSVATGITVLGGGTIHFLQRMYQQDLRTALEDAHGRIFGLAFKEGFRREENSS